ncbi:MAG: DNA-binding protein YbiB [Burkholderiaceae bacterium]
MQITEFIKEIGRGGAGARSLDTAQSRSLFSAMFAGQVGEFELGCVLIALRMKGESVDEIDGALDALDAHLRRIAVDPQRPAVAIPSYNGARRLPNLVPLLACLLAREGIQVVVHGVRDDPKRLTTYRLMQALALPVAGEAPFDSAGSDGTVATPGTVTTPGTAAIPGTAAAPDTAAAAFAADQPLFIPIDLLSPPLAAMLALRQRAGVRNVAHTLAKLIEPCAPGSLRLASFTHPEFDRLQHALFERRRAHALVMRGTEGEVVADPRRQSAIDELRNGSSTRRVEAETRPLAEVPELPPAHDAAATAAWIREVLAGRLPVPANIERQVRAIIDCAGPAAQSASG